MSVVTDKYRGIGEYFSVFNELVKAARHRGTATYQELADLVIIWGTNSAICSAPQLKRRWHP
jgi:hypothetical protein